MVDPTGKSEPQNYDAGDWALSFSTLSTGKSDPQNYDAGDWALSSSTLSLDAFAEPLLDIDGELLGWLDNDGPYLDNQDPLPLSTGVSLSKDISFDLLDDEENIDLSTVTVWIDGSIIYNGSTDSFTAPFLSSTRTSIYKGHHFNLHVTGGWASAAMVITRVYAVDIGEVTLDESWSFTSLTSLAMTEAKATSYTTIEVSYSAAMTVGPTGSDKSATNPSNYTIVGGSGITITGISPVSNMVFKFSVTSMRDLVAYTVIADGTVESIDGTTIAVALLSDPNADRKSFVGTADLPRLIQVTNPAVGILNVDFSKAMRRDVPLMTVESYTVVGLGVAKPLFITGVSFDESLPSRVVLSYTGGGSIYRMTIFGIYEFYGNPLDPDNNSAVFELLYPTVDELFSGNQVFMDTNLGAIQLTYNTFSKRRIEDLAIIRAQSIGYSSQFALIADSLKDSGINRDDTRLKLFKG